MTTTVAEGGTPPAAPNPPAETPRAAAPVAPPTADDQNPPWLAARLERERRTALSELGIKDPAKAKEILTAAEKAAQEAKTQGERLGETNAKLTALEQQNAELRGAVEQVAKSRLAQLTDAQRKAVTDLAGDGDDLDAPLAIQLIESLAPTWAAPAAAASSAQAPTPSRPAPTTPPTGTAPPPNAPASTTLSQPNHQEVHAGLLKTNPFAAASYALEHMADVFPEQRT